MASLRYGIWPRVRRRRTAIIALCVIGFFCFLALFAYPLSPDDSRHANQKISELKERPPGLRKLFLYVPIRAGVPSKGIMARIFNGTEPSHTLLPINGFYFARDSVFVTHYLRKGRHETLGYTLKSLLPPQLHNKPLGEQQIAVYRHALGTRNFLLGTDREGRDILSRLLIGARVSVIAGSIGMILALGLGLSLGGISAFFGGWPDWIVMFLIRVFGGIPGILLSFGISLALGGGLFQTAIAVGLTMWAGSARIVRDEVFRQRRQDFIQSARMLGIPQWRIFIRQILPDIALPLMSIAAASFGAAVLLEAGLSFLGIGTPAPIPSWGLMLREQYHQLRHGWPLLALIPAFALVILVTACNLLSQSLRDGAEAKENADS